MAIKLITLISILVLSKQSLPYIATIFPQLTQLSSIYQIILYQLISLGPGVLYSLYVIKPEIDILRHSYRLTWMTPIAFFLLGTYALSISSGIFALEFFGTGPKTKLKQELLTSYPTLTFISAVLIAPVFEEVIFRHGMYNMFDFIKQPYIKMTSVALIFTFFHGLDWASIALIGLSFGLTYMYHTTQLLIYPIIIHVVFNFISLAFTHLNSHEGKNIEHLSNDNSSIYVTLVISSVFAFIGYLTLKIGTKKFRRSQHQTHHG